MLQSPMDSPRAKKVIGNRKNNGVMQRVRIKGSNPLCPQPSQYSDINQFLIDVRREVGLCLGLFKQMQRNYNDSPEYHSKAEDIINKTQRNLSTWAVGMKLQHDESELERKALLRGLLLFAEKQVHGKNSVTFARIEERSKIEVT